MNGSDYGRTVEGKPPTPPPLLKSEKTSQVLRLLSLLLLPVCLPALRADYPVASHRYLADPAPLVTPERVYVYCSNDDLNPVEGGYAIPSVVCVSSSDMKNWTDHGVVFDAARDTKWAQKSWAPSPIGRDGKVFLYFGNGGATIGVVAAEKPEGPFLDVLGKPLVTHGTPGVQPAKNLWLFDPAAFIDDDGQAYLYFGGNGDDNVRVIKLNRDMVSVDGPALAMHAPNFFEAAWVHKKNGLYYFSYSTTPKAAMRIDYMTSDKPTSGFAYRGIVADQPPINNNNNHAAIFEFKGQWYHVYHNRIVAHEAGIPTGFRRNLALERLDYEADGSIRKTTYSTDGVPQQGHIDPYVRVEGETFYAQQGLKTDTSSAGGMAVSWASAGSWLRLRGVDFGSDGARSFSARIASGSEGGSIELHLGSLEGQLVGTVATGGTGGWQNWRDVSCEVKGATGVQDLYLKFVGAKGALLSLDYWRFER